MMQDVHRKLNPGLPSQTHFNKKKALFTSNLDLELRKKQLECRIWSIGLCGAENWTLRKVDQKCLESFET